MTVRVRSVPPCVSSQIGSRYLPLKQGIVSSSLTWRTKLMYDKLQFVVTDEEQTPRRVDNLRNRQTEVCRTFLERRYQCLTRSYQSVAPTARSCRGPTTISALK